MTATPVNNSLWDLYYLLTYFIGHDAICSDIGIRSLKERFIEAVSKDVDKLQPDVLFSILDATNVRRTRHFVKNYYPNDRIIGPDGIEIAVQFPEPYVKAVTYSLDEALPGLFDDFAETLAPEQGPPKLTMARYCPHHYRYHAEPESREIALVGLIRSGLLKRFESSVYAFARILERMINANDKFLEGLEKGVILTAEAIEEWEQLDSDEAFNDLVESKEIESVEGFDISRLATLCSIFQLFNELKIFEIKRNKLYNNKKERFRS